MPLSSLRTRIRPQRATGAKTATFFRGGILGLQSSRSGRCGEGARASATQARPQLYPVFHTQVFWLRSQRLNPRLRLPLPALPLGGCRLERCRLRSTAPRCPQVFRRQALSQDTTWRTTSHDWDPSEELLFPMPGSHYRQDGSDEPCVAEPAAAGDQLRGRAQRLQRVMVEGARGQVSPACR